MKPFSLLIKPTAADCNLACEYCFYSDRKRLYPECSMHRMSSQVLERVISSFMAIDMPHYSFSWQGGEPTLMGTDFFRLAARLQRKYHIGNTIVSNGIQTNATLVDREMASCLAEHDFLVGGSLDGPAGGHDSHRRTDHGQPSHSRVMRGINYLKEYGAEFNILTVVSRSNVRQPGEIYHYLRDQGFFFQQYIPCVEFDGEGEPLPYSITAEEWGSFLCGIYDEWIGTDARRVSVRLFDCVLMYLTSGRHYLCPMERDCRNYFVVEHNGDIYPCDFFVEEELKLGNIQRDTWEEMWNSRIYKEFGSRKSSWNPECAACEFLPLCAGDCLKHREWGKGPDTLSWLCEGWKIFYAHALPGFKSLVDKHTGS